MLFLTEIVRGMRFRVLALGARDTAGTTRVPFLELRALLARDCPREQRQLERILNLTAQSGPPFSLHKAKRVTDFDVCEFRTRGGTRLFWVYGAQHSVILLNGFRKRGWSIPQQELQRAQRWACMFTMARLDLTSTNAGSPMLADRR